MAQNKDLYKIWPVVQLKDLHSIPEFILWEASHMQDIQYSKELE